MMAKKTYVEVIASFGRDGTMMPLEIGWEDGRRFPVDRVLDVRQAASTKVGGCGVRYNCRIFGKQTYLFFEEDRWFVESKER